MREKNRNILSQTLKQLPVYQPPEDVWPGLQEQLINKKNPFSSLPKHQAPDQIWDKLNSALIYEEKEQNRSLLKQKLAELPLHRPGINHWFNIEVALEQREKQFKHQKYRFIFSSAAAVIIMGLVFSAFLWISHEFHQNTASNSVAEKALPDALRLEEGELIYSEETILQLFNWQTQDIEFSRDTLSLHQMPVLIPPALSIDDYLKNDLLWRSDPELLNLQKELEVLDQALEQLSKAFPYQQDTIWIQRTTEIEHARAEIVQKIIRRY